jgi:hypothetical protein
VTVTISHAGLDGAQRTQLDRLVSHGRLVLEEDLRAQLEGRFGIHADGKIEDEESLPDDATDRATRSDLVEIVEHLRTLGESEASAVARLLREAAFTHLNRLLAIRVAEAINLFPESLAGGLQSRGFKDLGEVMPIISDDYWGYLLLCGDELAADAPALFDPRNPLLSLAPSTHALNELVALLAEPEATNLWLASDTLGWAYQFFNTSDERRSMRKEASAPRNSHELAVRNQFFTPRYVVDFLVQNTLGRRIVESDPSNQLLDEMLLLVDPPSEPGPALDLHDVAVLDPACGSGHFLLGCYDLLERAWELEGVSPSKSAPSIVSALWGVDIDPRCAQVASAVIVMRARRHCRDLPLPRPNIVTARSLPGAAAALPPNLSLTLEQRHLVDRLSEALADAPLLGTLLKAEEALEQEIRGVAFGGAAGALALNEEASDQAEKELMDHLQAIADLAFSSVAERLLAAEADDALRLVEAVRRRYDVVLMNPPFGEPVPATKRYLRGAFEWLPSTGDLFAAFVGRGLELCKPDGYMGAITSRVGLFLSGFESWRRQILLARSLTTLADLGDGVMEQATVEAAAYVIGAKPRTRPARTTFLRVVTAVDRASALIQAVSEPADGSSFVVDLDAFDAIPGSPIAYWVDTDVVAHLISQSPFEPKHGTVRQGLATGDDFRFVRAWWEVSARKLTRPPSECGGKSQSEQLSTGARWAPIVKSGASQPWFSPVLLVVDWENDGQRLKTFVDAAGKVRSRPQNTDVYFLPGFSWTRRATRLIPYVVPAGCIPSVSRYQAFPSHDPYEGVGLVASNISTAFCRFYGGDFHRPNFLVDNIKRLPIAGVGAELASDVRDAVVSGVEAGRRYFATREPFREFVGPGDGDMAPPAWNRRSLLGAELDLRVAASYGLTRGQFEGLDRDLQEACDVLERQGRLYVDSPEGEEEDAAPFSQRLLSYLVGVAFGRWDVRIGVDPSLVPQTRDPFEPMPACPPGMLTGEYGRPVQADDPYPITLPESGLLIDESGHRWDVDAALVRAGEAYLGSTELVFKLAEDLGRKSLRQYLRKRFFKDHLTVYSAGGRKAPIYWPLTVPSTKWGVWAYAPTLSRETLYSLASEAARRERLAAEAVARLQGEQKDGSSGRPPRKLAEELDSEEKLAEELRQFRTEADRIAGLGWDPDLDDGLVLCAAPLADLFPAWPDAKKARDELRGGRYGWATVSRWAGEL